MSYAILQQRIDANLGRSNLQSVRVLHTDGEEMAVVPVVPCTRALIDLRNEPKWHYDVFLCHEGNSSKNFGKKIFAALAGNHIRAFVDANCIYGTQNICPTLARTIRKSRFVMVILTPQIIGKKHPTHEYHLARERHRAEQCSTRFGVVLPVFYTISPDKVSQYLDIEVISERAGYERMGVQSDDDFIRIVVIPKFTQLVKKVINEKEGTYRFCIARIHMHVQLTYFLPILFLNRTDKGQTEVERSY